MGRHILYFVCFICLLVSSFMMLTAWERVARGQGRAAGPIKQGLQQPRDRAIASTVQGIRLVGMPEYKFYWVGNSTIPGAGLGVFARQNMPAGTLWNPEDANPESTLAIRLPLWQSLVGLVEYLKAAGHSNHPLTALWSFFDIYGYICGDHFIVALTGNTFTNHAPEPPDSGGASSLQKGATALNRKMATGPLQQLQGTGSDTVRYANSGDILPTSRWAQGLSSWQICTTSVTLRDIQAGEEMLEDYFKYSPPCQGRNACPEFMHEQQQQHSDFGSELDADEHPPEEWNHATMVQLHDTYAATSSGPGGVGGGGLGVFAARDLSRGSVWNKEDAIHSFAITRGQWTMLLILQESLKASRVSKPIIDALVNTFRSNGLYCPLDDRMYVPFTHSLLARRGRLLGNGTQTLDGGGSSGSGSTGKQQLHRNQQPANSARVVGPGLGQAAGIDAVAAGQAARCTWLFTVAAVPKGEEILVGHSQQHECDWPGVRQ